MTITRRTSMALPPALPAPRDLEPGWYIVHVAGQIYYAYYKNYWWSIPSNQDTFEPFMSHTIVSLEAKYGNHFRTLVFDTAKDCFYEPIYFGPYRDNHIPE